MPRAAWGAPTVLDDGMERVPVEGVVFEAHAIKEDPAMFKDAWEGDHLVTTISGVCIAASRTGFLPPHLLDANF